MGVSVRVALRKVGGKNRLAELSSVVSSLIIICLAIILSFSFNQYEGTGDSAKGLNKNAMTTRAVEEEDWGPLEEYEPVVKEYARKYDVDPALVRAVMMHESEGNARLVSRAGALGLMQCMPDKFAPGEDPFNPRTNIKKGTKYLAAMLDKFGTAPLAVAAYNAGPGAVIRYGGIPPYPETEAYVPRVIETYKRYCRDK